ncbi:MAG: phosphoglycerate mutase (2,3-diphosphoglycerate-independent) [Verrucomicrobia bacterium RIFCSPLOWO2_12_FULL_64_8]|nr:MAG: phosphoglycerate mutase (2,3-diphosphoglycerate-independent) [Verrucomicrobia bacterium RIFCSPLOWO2_12_FULL_64_8]
MSVKHRPVLLVVRDGWGKNPNPAHDQFNAVHCARKPYDDQLHARFPAALVKACGLDVGVPDGVMGNSEVGHQNIGAGRIVDQEIVRISKALADGEIAGIPVWRELLDRAKARGTRLHFMGLASNAGVHSLLEHLYGLLKLAREAGVAKNIFVHAFMDGRDTPPTSGLRFIKQLEAKLAELGVGQVASVCGRFYSMDRDNRWERVSRAYAMLTGAKAAAAAPSATAAVQQYYDKPTSDSQKGDEFVVPTWVVDARGRPVGAISDGDSVVFFNFRGDRPREICRAFGEEDFKAFDRGRKLDLYFAGLTEYQKGLPIAVILKKPPKMKNTLGEYMAAKGLAQFRCAETEKYPHVTFFFNDYREEPFPGENRVLVASPKVTTYDLAPDMSSMGVTVAARDAILSGKYDLLIVNYANPDMVGHTGSLPAAIRACEATDLGTGVLVDATLQMGGAALVCADHGNAEQMWDPEQNCPHTAHTLNPVEVFVVGEEFAAGKTTLRPGGRLADLAPTLL